MFKIFYEKINRFKFISRIKISFLIENKLTFRYYPLVTDKLKEHLNFYDFFNGL